MGMSEDPSRRGSSAPSTSEGELPSPEAMRQASSAEIFDEQGSKTTFGELCGGKRTVVVLIRHFWCLNCQAYVSQLGETIPPANLPEGTQVVVIGCGSYQPIKQYAEASHSPYPIYANPSLSLYTAFNCVSNYGTSKKGEEKEYEKDLGSSTTRVWQALVQGPAKHLEHVNYVGPKGQNGAELVVDSDGSCSFFHRMRHTADHAELRDLAKAVGAEYSPSTKA